MFDTWNALPWPALTNTVNLSDDKQPEPGITAAWSTFCCDKVIRLGPGIAQRRKPLTTEEEQSGAEKKCGVKTLNGESRAMGGFKDDDSLSLNCFESLVPAGSWISLSGGPSGVPGDDCGGGRGRDRWAVPAAWASPPLHHFTFNRSCHLSWLSAPLPAFPFIRLSELE